MAKKIQAAHAGTQPAKSAVKPKKMVGANRSEAHAAIEEELFRALQSQLPYWQLSAEESSRSVIFAKYLDSLAKLNACRDELVALGFSLGRATISYDSPPLDAVRVEKEKEIADEYRIQLDSPVNNAGADLGALSVEEIRDHLNLALNNATRKLITQFVDGLAALMGRQLIGMAHWPSENTIKYWYCRHRVTTQAAFTTASSQLVRSRTDTFDVHRLRTDIVEHRKVQYVPTTVTRECHRHDAIDAHICSIKEATVVIPQNVKELIDAIPAWMRPSIRIADGYLIRKRNEDRQTISSSVISQVDVREEVTTTYFHGTDPALLLGSLVLIGWGPAEIEQERQAEGERQIVAQCLSGATDWGVPVFIIQILILVLGNKLVVHPVGLMLVMFAFASSVFCLARCIHYAFRAKSIQMKQWEFQLTVAGPALIFAGLEMFIVLGSLPWMVMGVLIACLGTFLLIKFPFYRSL